MLQIGADVEVAEFPVVLVGVYAVGQEDKDDFVFGIGPRKGASEARVSKRCLGCQDIAGATPACSWPIKAGGAAVGGAARLRLGGRPAVGAAAIGDPQPYRTGTPGDR